MAIEFLEARQLLSGGEVKAGEIRSFSPEVEEAFINNGVAKAVDVKKGKEEKP